MFSFLVLPGVVTWLVPLLLAPERPPGPVVVWQWAGLVPVAVGTSLVLFCARQFYRDGRGTLAPWSPPRRLVTAGIYARSRNPMYVAALMTVLGWAVVFRSAVLLVYAAFLALAFHLRVLLFEEPRLRASFGEDWLHYAARVRRWL